MTNENKRDWNTWSLFLDKPINGISIRVPLTVYFNLSIQFKKGIHHV
nr:MAG TPA: hypothetical protein [Caudoviricetes sp.]